MGIPYPLLRPSYPFGPAEHLGYPIEAPAPPEARGTGPRQGPAPARNAGAGGRPAVVELTRYPAPTTAMGTTQRVHATSHIMGNPAPPGTRYSSPGARPGNCSLPHRSRCVRSISNAFMSAGPRSYGLMGPAPGCSRRERCPVGPVCRVVAARHTLEEQRDEKVTPFEFAIAALPGSTSSGATREEQRGMARRRPLYTRNVWCDGVHPGPRGGT